MNFTSDFIVFLISYGFPLCIYISRMASNLNLDICFTFLEKRCLEIFSVVSYILLSCIVLFFLCKNFKLVEIRSIVLAIGEYY